MGPLLCPMSQKHAAHPGLEGSDLLGYEKTQLLPQRAGLVRELRVETCGLSRRRRASTEPVQSSLRVAEAPRNRPG